MRLPVFISVLLACSLSTARADMPAEPHGQFSRWDVNADGLKIFRQGWGDAKSAKAVFVLVHGLKDHSDRYDELARALVEKGVAVRAYDQRGHGRSEGRRGWVDRFDDYLDDLDSFLDSVREEFPGKPVFLFGHSMGGAVVTLYTLTYRPKIAGLLLSGAALDVPPVLADIVKVAGKIPLLDDSPIFTLKAKDFSRLPDVVKDVEGADPLVYPKNHTARLGSNVVRAVRRIRKQMDQLQVPVLAMHGSADKVTPPHGSRDLIEAAASKDKMLKIYDGFFHDITHDVGSERVVQDIVKWVSDRVK